MKVSVNVMAHPARAHFIPYLQEKLGADVRIVWDERSDRWDTGRRALLDHDPDADWGVTIQDDALLCRDFRRVLARALAVPTGRPIAFYTGKVRPHQHTITPAVRAALRTRTPWLAARGPYWGVAIALPLAEIADVVRFGDNCEHIPNYDRRIEAFYTGRGIDCWYTVPSLVDHRAIDENPSLIRGRTGNRRAHAFLGQRTPMRIDWTRPPLNAGGRLMAGPQRVA